MAVKYLISAAYDYTTYTVRHENTSPPYFGPHFSNDSARAKREEIQTETRGSRVPVPVGRTPGRDRQPLRVHLRRHLNAVDIPDMRARREINARSEIWRRSATRIERSECEYVRDVSDVNESMPIDAMRHRTATCQSAARPRRRTWSTRTSSDGGTRVSAPYIVECPRGLVRAPTARAGGAGRCAVLLEAVGPIVASTGLLHPSLWALPHNYTHSASLPTTV